VRLVHRRNGETRVLASDVDVARGLLQQARGLMFRRSIPDDYALLFPFDTPDTRSVHMMFVPFALDVLWLVDDEVAHKKRLRPWVGLGRGTADAIIELPAGVADEVSEGDVVQIQE
jgi:uncharacterized membrane protein (UPF0127 family)